MYTDLQIANLGLMKLGQSRVDNLSPPKSTLERHVATGFTQWVRSELSMHWWLFAMKLNVTLAQTSILDGVDKKYVYELPVGAIKPRRTRYTEWVRARRYLHSENSTLKIDYVDAVPTAEFDPLFVDVMAWRVARECLPLATQSAAKENNLLRGYDDAVAEAKRQNAFLVGTDDVAVDDYSFDFLSSRYV